MKNISFWEFVNDSYVKIKLRPGQRLHWSKRRRDEEGYSWRGETWMYCDVDNILINQYYYGGTDCDGGVGAGGERYSKLDELKSNPSYAEPAILRPMWKNRDEWQQDFQAELAGY